MRRCAQCVVNLMNLRHNAKASQHATPKSLTCLPTGLAQAQGEAMVRRALQELKLWALQREFAFNESDVVTGASSGCGRRVPLIREWRDLLSQVGDRQSLVSSLKQAHAYAVFKVGLDCGIVPTCTRDA